MENKLKIYPFTEDESHYITSYKLFDLGTKISDIPYSDQSERNVFDLYVPKTEGPYPLIIFIHSGGLCGGDKTRHLSVMLQGLQYGYALASVSYRLTTTNTYDDIVYDSISAVRFIKKNAAKYNIDASRIVFCGETHGAHIMSTLAINAYNKEFQDQCDLYRDTDTSVNGVITFYPVINFKRFMKIEDDYFLKLPTHTKEYTYIEELMYKTKDVEKLKEIADKEVIPVENANHNTPPFFVVHSKDDAVFPIQMSEDFVSDLKKQGVDATLYALEGSRHGWADDKFVDGATLTPMYEFIEKVFNRVE